MKINIKHALKTVAILLFVLISINGSTIASYADNNYLLKLPIDNLNQLSLIK